MTRNTAREDTKYGDKISDDFFKPEQPDEPETEPRVTTALHALTLKERVDDEYLSHYEWRFSIDHDGDDRVIRGWTKTDVEHNGTEDYCNEGTWQSMPVDVKMELASALGVRRSELEGMLDLPEHLLEGGDDEQEPVTDGGFETAESEWSRRITTKQGIDDLLTDLDVGVHNMWVDVREEHPGFSGYEAVTVDVTVSITGGRKNGGADDAE